LAADDAEVLIDRIWLGAEDGSAWGKLRERLARMERPVFPLQGRDLMALGIPAGPRLGVVLREVREWWMRGGCVADAQACREQASLLPWLSP
jgi:poly(A) polymerase/tRNA nucleotidyltransferase (CCA-adding enzyme)